MKRKLTITVSEEVYSGLHAVIGTRKISQFLENLARPHVLVSSLAAGYLEASQDREQEDEALEWANALIGDAVYIGLTEKALGRVTG
jgi:predicted CopG family antitoxin